MLAPVDDAIAKGLRPEDPRRLKVTADEVAPMPATTPLSMRVDVPTVVAVNHRVANPAAPPVSDAESPRDDVATHLVEVPVVWRTIPRVPVELVTS